MDDPQSGEPFVTTETSVTPEEFKIWREARRAEEERNPNLRLKRLRHDSDWFAMMARHHGRNGPEFERQEQLIRDLRNSATRELELAVFEVRELDVDEVASELDGRVARIKSRLWYSDLPNHKNYADFRLSREELEKAVWEERWPSLAERVTHETARLKNFAAMQLPTNLKILRETCGWSQDDLCAQTGIPSKRRVGEYESGSKRPKPARLKVMADAFSEKLSIEPPLGVYELFNKNIHRILNLRRKAPR